jgi:hypothetical protein
MLFILYCLLLASFAICLAWTLIQLRCKSILLFCGALVVLFVVPSTFIYSRFTLQLDPHGTFGVIAGFTFLSTVIALLFVAMSPLRSKPILFLCMGILAYAVGFFIALTIGMNIGLYEK